jgi:hypothetical protein
MQNCLLNERENGTLASAKWYTAMKWTMPPQASTSSWESLPTAYVVQPTLPKARVEDNGYAQQISHVTSGIKILETRCKINSNNYYERHIEEPKD